MLRLVPILIWLVVACHLVGTEDVEKESVSLPPKIAEWLSKLGKIQKNATRSEATQQLELKVTAAAKGLGAKRSVRPGNDKLWLLWDLEVDGEWVLETIFVNDKIHEVSIRKGSVLFRDSGRGFERPRIYPYWRSGKKTRQQRATQTPTTTYIAVPCGLRRIFLLDPSGDGSPLYRMKSFFLLPAVLLLSLSTMLTADEARLAELDAYWAEVSKAVGTGDFAGYKATTHPEGILVSGNREYSQPLAKALARWEPEFAATKSGKVKSSVEFRFSKRLNDETTAHETGMFLYSSTDAEGKTTREYIHFEGLLLKTDRWRIVMEYQKSKATKEEWDALK